MSLRRRAYLLEAKSKKKSGLQKFMEKHGIVAKSYSNASIGFSEREQKWYGWSHRAIYGFGVGHKIKPGDIPAKFVGKTIKNLDQARDVAIAFSREVS